MEEETEFQDDVEVQICKKPAAKTVVERSKELFCKACPDVAQASHADEL